jgi:hypothetical protein
MSQRGFLAAVHQRNWAKHRRATNKALGRCINHPLTLHADPHPTPRPGRTKCDPCLEQHRRSAATVRTDC